MYLQGGKQAVSDSHRRLSLCCAGAHMRAELGQQERLAAAAAADVELQGWRRQGFESPSGFSDGTDASGREFGV